MVRHTHRRRNSRRRRQTRGRRTQKGGFSFPDIFSSTPNDNDIKKLQQKLNMETEPVEEANIQEELSIAQAKAQAKQIKDKTLEQIRERGATESNMGNQYGNKTQDYRQSVYSGNQYGNQEYRQFGDNNNARNAGQYGGSRRRRRHRRK